MIWYKIKEGPHELFANLFYTLKIAGVGTRVIRSVFFYDLIIK